MDQMTASRVASDLVSRLRSSRENNVRKISTFRATPEMPEERWEHPELSIGRFLCAQKKNRYWEAEGPAREAYAELGPKIRSFLDTSMEPTVRWVSFTIYMIGRLPESASPTIVFCCETAAHRKRARSMVKDSGILDCYSGVKTGHLPRDLGFDLLISLAYSRSGLHQSPPGGIEPPEILALPTRYPCGMQVFITQLSGHFREATVGGVVVLKGTYYYTTVEHVIDSGIPSEDIPTQDGDDDIEIDGDSNDADDVGNVSDPRASEDSVRSYDVENRGVDAERPSQLGTSNVPKIFPPTTSSPPAPPPRGEAIRTLRSVGELPANLAPAFSLGRKFISSRNGQHAGLDYAFVEVLDTAHKGPNMLPRRKHRHDPFWTGEVVKTGASTTRILAVTQRGLIEGTMSSTSSYARSPSGQAFHEMYRIRLDKPLNVGDSGSWVINKETGHLFGYIVAGSPTSGAALVMPFVQVFDDLECRYDEAPRIPVADLPTAKFAAADEGQRLQELWPGAPPGDRGPAEMIANLDEWSWGMKMKFTELQLKANDRKRSVNPGGSLRDGPSTSAIRSASIPRTRPAGSRETSTLLAIPRESQDLEVQKFEKTLTTLSSTPLQWERKARPPHLIDEALRIVPSQLLMDRATDESQTLQAIAMSMSEEPEWGYRDCLAMELMRWFRRDFFTWVDNKPPCPVCKGQTKPMGKTPPEQNEKSGGVIHVELYQCVDPKCSASERFPRYNNLWRLLQTRKGRSGEWAACFGLFCRALDFRTRWVSDFQQHVWVEIYSVHQSRWIHVDPCFEAWDTPGMYTKKGKRLNYCIAFSADGVVDVSRRYIRNPRYFAGRKKCTEGELSYILHKIKNTRRKDMKTSVRFRLEAEDCREDHELWLDFVTSCADELSRSARPLRAHTAGDSSERRLEENEESEELSSIEDELDAEAERLNLSQGCMGF